jgi:rhodanese-related sulfurtransferase
MRGMLGQAAVIVLAAILAAAGTHVLHPKAPAWYRAEEPLREGEVTMALIREQWSSDVLWVDARLRRDYEAGHVPGALLLNEQEADQLLFDHFEKLQDNKKPIVVYCGTEACQASQKMAAYLRERLPGMEILVLKGGWDAWQKAQKNR